MNPDTVVALISALNIGSIIAALGAWRKAGQSTKELTHNHGSSTKDAVSRIEKTQVHQSEMIKSLGHQIGEIHDTMSQTTHLIGTQLGDMQERVRLVEKRPCNACHESSKHD